ncbi:MAG: hypothetical protein AMJ91_03235 [candidate division Zixibacteria bacterium SM23_73_3]|nr:MAG: hypothetical protein AMJ91_03235 [candidate division Zixibacteria bacterium SM23_73_3]
MKKNLLVLTTTIILFGLTGFAWGQDPGIPDTLYVICYDSCHVSPPPWEVHFLLLVTHDVPDPAQDSVSGIIIPLKVTHTNPTAYCSLTSERNTMSYSDSVNSIFRHFGGRENYMMSLYENGLGEDWGTKVLNLTEDDFWLSVAASGQNDQLWGPGSQVLLVTMTLLVEDTMTVCIDTNSFPGVLDLQFAAGILPTYTYIPQHNMPVCAKIRSGQRGDVNGDGFIDLADVLFLVSYLYKDGPAPDPLEAGDVDFDGDIDLGDLLYLVNYLYKGGPSPGCP